MLRRKLIGVVAACLAIATLAFGSVTPGRAASLGGAAASVEEVVAPTALHEVPPNQINDLTDELVDLLFFVLKRAAQRLLPPPGGFWVG